MARLVSKPLGCTHITATDSLVQPLLIGTSVRGRPLDTAQKAKDEGCDDALRARFSTARRLPRSRCSRVAELDPVMVPLGFAAGQAGFGDDSAQVIYCEPHQAGDGLCADVMIDLEDSSVGWRIAGVEYDGFAMDEVAPLRLDRDATLVEQLAFFARPSARISDERAASDNARSAVGT